MKNYLLILVSTILLFPTWGCKKKSFDPTSKNQADFIGTWTGSISTFKNNKLLKEYGSIVIYQGVESNLLSGILFMTETNIIQEFQFVKGTLYFNVLNSDPNNPFCQNWSLGGYAIFSDDNTLDLRITGNECGDVGSEFVNWVGTMASTVVSPDSVEYYNFAKSGNSWTYKITLKNGDSCQVQKQINQVPSNYFYTGVINQTCGWTGQSLSFKWNVSPSTFSILNDSTLCEKSISFLINAKLGVVYRSVKNNDTITTTLLDTTSWVTTPAGNFICNYFRYTEPVKSGLLQITRTSYVWFNNRYGIIRQEVANPVDSNDVRVQVLSAKNF